MLGGQEISEAELSMASVLPASPAGEPGVSGDVVWPSSRLDLITPEVAAYVRGWAAHGVPAPEEDDIGYELGEQAWQAELAWPEAQVAVIAPGPEAGDCLAAYAAAGWDARLPADWPPDELAQRVTTGGGSR